MSAPSKHAENSAATRARLLELGLERFPQKGYSATSIRDLLDGSGLAIGAFYYHFASKTEFFLALLDHVSGPPGAFGALAQSTHPATLEEAILIAMGPLASDPTRGAMSLVVADFALAHRHEPEVRDRVAEVRRHAVREIADFLGVMQERRLVRADLAPELLGSMVFATVEGHVFHQEIYGEGFETAFDAAVRILRP
jgi:AcrR family transcriptional regulator